MVDQPFAASEIGESMDADLLPELSGETWVASALTEEFTEDLLPAGSNIDLIAESRQLFIFRPECIGQDCEMMFGHILHRVQYA